MGDTSSPQLAVHPTVVLSIGDHHQRVAKHTTKRVVGVLLGEMIDGKTHASNSFGVPFEEDSKDLSIWYLDHHYLESMAYMFSKINKKEKIIGWYSTAGNIKPADLEIHELLRRYTPFPIFLVVDIKQEAKKSDPSELPFKSYISHEEPCSDRVFRRSFRHIEAGVAQFEAEEVGVEHLLRDLQNTSTSTRSTEITNRLKGIQALQKKLKETANYIQQVIDGSLPFNPLILNHLQNLLNLCPDLGQSDLINSFHEESTAAMLAIFLGTAAPASPNIFFSGVITRSILALHDLVRNRIQLQLKGSINKKN